MRKLLYVSVIAAICALSFSGCTEEEIKPKKENAGGGGASHYPGEI